MAKYSVEFKLEVVNSYHTIGLSATCRKYSLSTSTIQRWIRKRESVGFMRKKVKTYTREEKLDILYYYWKFGCVETEKKYEINNSVFYRWERLFHEYGVEGLDYDGRGKKPKSIGNKKDVNLNEDLLAENQRLRMENLYLKKLDALVQKREEKQLKKKSK